MTKESKFFNLVEDLIEGFIDPSTFILLIRDLFPLDTRLTEYCKALFKLFKDSKTDFNEIIIELDNYIQPKLFQ